ncbi:hypothetical protein H5410_027748 [Solanum commersonii]|uniref:Alliinase C-terminal domain-containing protein n=1 Tax=Solanum commersonii TaxID=4109 RepID=A0A9J5Z2S2_SOLCO|nr:hypothetical protein H5410_027748 [Solanum commersonii]
MLFIISKRTSHVGSRISWALFKDKEVARKMTKFMDISTIVVSNSCLDFTLENFFEYSQSLMSDRWKMFRKVVTDNDLSVLQNCPLKYCLLRKDLCITP